MIPADLKYTEEHEWVRMEDDIATIGITDFAQEQLTDIVFVELPEVGQRANMGESTAVLESVKSVADIYAPMNGEIVEVNETLEAHPEFVNESPYENGWIFKIKTTGPGSAKFMDAEGYQAFIEAEDS